MRPPKNPTGGDMSLTSQISKVMELLVRGAIIDHLYSKKLTRDTHNGFTQGGRVSQSSWRR